MTESVMLSAVYHLPSILFHHQHHHSHSTILSPSTNLQGWAWCGETQYPLTTSPSIHPPVRANRNSATEIQKGENKRKERADKRWRRKTQCFTSVSCDHELRFCFWKSQRRGIVKTELERRKIKNVEDSGKSFVVFSTNCEFSFVILPCIILVTAVWLSNMYKMSGTCWRVAKEGRENKTKQKKKGRDIK